jgi:cell division control protein 6
MEPIKVRTKIVGQIQHMVDSTIIKDRRFLDDEQLIKSEQLAVLEEIFNANVRDTEIKELSSHFAAILRGDHPCHMAIWGKTGTGKTLTLSYFLNLLSEMCHAKNIPICYEHLDLSNPRPCFRALNDLACLLNASKRYQKGISLEEMMTRIEAKLAGYQGYLVLFIDEVDNVRRDRDNFLTFLVRRLPQKITAKLILIFVSNRLDWPDHLDPRVKSFLKLNELIFKPYNAIDLQHILRIRVEKALNPETVEPGVIEKIAAMASREHGDARKAIALLAKSAYLAEKAGTKITLTLVDKAATELDRDRYLTLVSSAPQQLQAAMAGVIEATRRTKNGSIGTGEAYDA